MWDCWGGHPLLRLKLAIWPPRCRHCGCDLRPTAYNLPALQAALCPGSHERLTSPAGLTVWALMEMLGCSSRGKGRTPLSSL